MANKLDLLRSPFIWSPPRYAYAAPTRNQEIQQGKITLVSLLCSGQTATELVTRRASHYNIKHYAVWLGVVLCCDWYDAQQATNWQTEAQVRLKTGARGVVTTTFRVPLAYGGVENNSYLYSVYSWPAVSATTPTCSHNSRHL